MGGVPDEADGRYAPLRGPGAISQWQLDLPLVNQSHRIRGTIPDVGAVVKLHGARRGGPGLRSAVPSQELEARGYDGSVLVFLANRTRRWFGPS